MVQQPAGLPSFNFLNSLQADLSFEGSGVDVSSPICCDQLVDKRC
jgi:hypothetical protein